MEIASVYKSFVGSCNVVMLWLLSFKNFRFLFLPSNLLHQTVSLSHRSVISTPPQKARYFSILIFYGDWTENSKIVYLLIIAVRYITFPRSISISSNSFLFR